MRIREKGYSDYGIGQGEEKELKRYCRGVDFSEHYLLEQAAKSANIDIYRELCESLVKGLSYEKLDQKDYVPISKVDFYAYQRLCLYKFRNLLILFGKWG